ncbi:penicillin-binding protein [Marinobacter caseinilyticus]|uniref:penicillin-binding protein n=1 Tax=Marinobacter caseinilyticus TaxID=2692195 RepID=UPI00140DE231|nr:penicillin-binding protein [Marinobacter caseinilyticus]
MVDEDTLRALKTAFTFMPNPVEVTRYDYGDQADKMLKQINFVREVLASHGIDPDEVAGDINPESTPNSCY